MSITPHLAVLKAGKNLVNHSVGICFPLFRLGIPYIKHKYSYDEPCPYQKEYLNQSFLFTLARNLRTTGGIAKGFLRKHVILDSLGGQCKQ